MTDKAPDPRPAACPVCGWVLGENPQCHCCRAELKRLASARDIAREVQDVETAQLRGEAARLRGEVRQLRAQVKEMKRQNHWLREGLATALNFMDSVTNAMRTGLDGADNPPPGSGGN